MPIRHEGDYQRREIKSWDSWIDEAILEAQERGDFDNLPDAGKPIQIETSPFAPDMQAALSTLKNAGYAPTWMELDREITHAKHDLETFLERSAVYLEAQYRHLSSGQSAPRSSQPAVKPGWWTRVLRWITFAGDTGSQPAHSLTVADLNTIRSRMRDQYLERAAAIDKKITEFHAALPRNLWHLERMRLTQEFAAKTFDSRMSTHCWDSE